MDSDSMMVKVYVMDEGERVDVRRFAIPNRHMTYRYLYNRFKATIPILLNRMFKIYWLDSFDVEVIVISNDDLMMAISENTDVVCKFVVRLKPKSAIDTDQSTLEVLNPDNICDQLRAKISAQIVCNGCSNRNRSRRYQCLECDGRRTQVDNVLRTILAKWADRQKIHDAYALDLQERQAMYELQKKLKHFEEDHKRKAAPTSDVSPLEVSDEFEGLCTLINALIGKVSEKETAETSNAIVPQKVIVDGPPTATATEDPWLQDEARALSPTFDAAAPNGFISNVSNEYKKESAVKANELVDEPLEDSWLEDAACALSPSFGAAATNGFTSKPSNESNDDATPSFNEWLVDEPPDKSWFQDEARALSPSSGAAAPPGLNPSNECKEDTAHANELVDEPVEESWLQDEARALSPSYVPPIHKDSKLDVALDMLAEMGFVDEKQWLARLLEYYDYDVAATLDRLTLDD